MNIKTITIISSSLILVVAVVLTLALMLSGGDTNASNLILRVNANDITLYKGDIIENYYFISNKDAMIEIEVDKTGIINIDENRIEALSVGEVNVTINVSLDESVAKDTFKVTVKNYDYSFEFDSLNGCYYKDMLYVTNDLCYFKFNILDEYGKKMNVTIDSQVNNDAVLIYEIGVYMLQCQEDCTLIMNAKEINYKVEINVKVIK